MVYRGFLFYSLLTVPGVAVGCKVALVLEPACLAFTTPALWRCYFLCLYVCSNRFAVSIVLPVFIFIDILLHFSFITCIPFPLRPSTFLKNEAVFFIHQ